jgi:hypothetical protein
MHTIKNPFFERIAPVITGSREKGPRRPYGERRGIMELLLEI